MGFRKTSERRSGICKTLLLALFCVSTAFADDAPKKPLIGDSFDPAASANAQLAQDASKSQCDNLVDAAGNALPASAAQACKTNSQNIAQAGKSISQEQNVMGNISRVSNVAAVGAVGATAIAQFAMKDDSQAKSLTKVANIEKTAGYVSMAAGATDLGLGAYALMKENGQLQNLKKTAVGATGASSGISSDLDTAIKKTHDAAISHLVWGAGKAAAGFVSLEMAKANEKAAADLTSLSAAAASAVTTVPIVQGNGSAAFYQNNTPTFGTDAATAGASTAAGTTPTPVGSSSGSSVLAPGGSASEMQGNLPAGGAASPPGDAAAGAGDALLGANSGAKALEASVMKSIAPNLIGSAGFGSAGAGGGGPGYMGGRSDSGGGGPDIGSMLSAALGMGPAAASNGAATGINPNEIYANAVTGRTPASDPGVSAKLDKDLFQMIREKHIDMLEKGRLLGPKVVIK